MNWPALFDSFLYRKTPFHQLGGRKKVKEIVERFYHHMDQMPEAKECRDLHPKSLEKSKEKLYFFLCGWLGGPSLYIQKYGHPRLRARHFPFSIGEKETMQWLMCMNRALDELIKNDKLKQDVLNAMTGLAHKMRNRD